ncbi:MAG: hypothetical protein ABI599_03055 [Flavobacteriales bacterium]
MHAEHHRIAILHEQALLRQGAAGSIGQLADFKVVANAADPPEFKRAFGVGAPPDIVLLSGDIALADRCAFLSWCMNKMPDTKLVVLGEGNSTPVQLTVLCCGAHAYLCTEHASEQFGTAFSSVLQGAFYFPELPRESLGALRPPMDKEQHALLERKPAKRQAEFLHTLRLYPGETYEQIGARMGITKKTAEGHAEVLCKRYGVKGKTGLLQLAALLGV